MANVNNIASLPGLGPASAKWLEQIGIVEVSQFIGADPFVLYARLHHELGKSNLNMLYAMIGAQQGIAWQQVKREQKEQIVFQLEDMGLLSK